MSQAWLSIVEYAREFSVSDMTVRRRIKTGKLRSEMRDGKYYIPVDVGHDGQYSRLGTMSSPAATKRPESRPANINPLTGSTMIVPSQNSTATKVEHAHVENRSVHATQKKAPAIKQSNSGKVSIEVQNLLNLCNNIISETKKKENMIKGRFESQINALTNELQVKNIENQQLQQQLEDLRLLIKIMEQT